MQAVILASGIGKRLEPLTRDLPKCLVKVHEVPILKNILDSLVAYGVLDVVITTGPFKEKIEAFVKEHFPELTVRYVHNPRFSETNAIYSLWLTREFINEDVIVLHSDLLYDHELLGALMDAPRTAALLNKKVRSDKDFQAYVEKGRVRRIAVQCFEKNTAFCLPFYKFIKQDWERWMQAVQTLIEAGSTHLYAEEAFNAISHEIDMQPIYYTEAFAMEIDDLNDLRIASEQNSPMQVSVVLCTYNSAATLGRCLDSIFAQTYSHFEVVTVDDASLDNTLTILKSYQKKFGPRRLRILKNPCNLGLTASLNKGIRAARGIYIARIDDDDWWAHDKLKQQVEFLEMHPEHGIVGTNYINVNERNQKRTDHVKFENDKEIRRTSMRYNPFAHSSVMIRKSLLKKVGGYDESIPYAQDYDLWLRCLPHTKFYNLQDFLCFRSIHAHSAISSQHQRHQALQGIKTRIKYIKKYGYPIKEYLYLLRPLLPLVTPRFLKEFKRNHF